MAELSFNLFYAGEHICVAAGGFSDKLAVLTETMLEKLKNYKVDPERFAKLKETVSLIVLYMADVLASIVLEQFRTCRTVPGWRLVESVCDYREVMDT